MKDLKKTGGWGGRRPGTGGARPGAGMPRGYKTKKTIAKEKAREIVRMRITAHLEQLVEAQIALAIGERHFLLRNKKTKRLELIADRAVIERAERTGEDGIDYFWIYTKDPDVPAFRDLMNRALDKPAQQVAVMGKDGGPVVFTWQE